MDDLSFRFTNEYQVIKNAVLAYKFKPSDRLDFYILLNNIEKGNYKVKTTGYLIPHTDFILHHNFKRIGNEIEQIRFNKQSWIVSTVYGFRITQESYRSKQEALQLLFQIIEKAFSSFQLKKNRLILSDSFEKSQKNTADKITKIVDLV